MKHNIVVPAWELVNEAHLIKKFNFLPSLLSTIYLSFIILYQIAFTYIKIFNLKDEFFGHVLTFVHQSYFMEVALIVAILLLTYLLLTPLSEGGLISLIDRNQKKDTDNYTYSFWLSRGIRNFLPIFEFNNVMSVFKLLSIVTFYIFLLRIFGMEYFTVITILAIIYLIFAFIANMLFAYTKFFIVFEDKKAFEAISLSVKMALDNLGMTTRLYFTLLLVYIRTILTAIILILFPFLISAILTYITIFFFKIVSIAILAALFLLFLVFVSHLNSVLEIFVETIWYKAYIENKKGE